MLGSDRVRTLVIALAVVFCVQGLSWVAIGSFEPTGFYDGMMAQALLGVSALPGDAATVFAFALVPFGATDAAYFALVAWIARHAFDQAWAWRAVAGSFLLWFAVDCAGCVWHGAWFNIAVVNLPCLAMFGTALALWRRALP